MQSKCIRRFGLVTTALMMAVAVSGANAQEIDLEAICPGGELNKSALMALVTQLVTQARTEVSQSDREVLLAMVAAKHLHHQLGGARKSGRVKEIRRYLVTAYGKMTQVRSVLSQEIQPTLSQFLARANSITSCQAAEQFYTDAVVKYNTFYRKLDGSRQRLNGIVIEVCNRFDYLKRRYGGNTVCTAAERSMLAQPIDTGGLIAPSARSMSVAQTKTSSRVQRNPLSTDDYALTQEDVDWLLFIIVVWALDDMKSLIQTLSDDSITVALEMGKEARKFANAQGVATAAELDEILRYLMSEKRKNLNETKQRISISTETEETKSM